MPKLHNIGDSGIELHNNPVMGDSHGLQSQK